MAYLDFAAAGGAMIDRGSAIAPRSFVKAAELTGLEWQVVALARRDRISSIRPAGTITRAMRWLFGTSVSNALSDARLEALRRIAVLSWYRGYSIASDEVRAFVAAGFSLDHYDLLLTHINSVRGAVPRRPYR